MHNFVSQMDWLRAKGKSYPAIVKNSSIVANKILNLKAREAFLFCWEGPFWGVGLPVGMGKAKRHALAVGAPFSFKGLRYKLSQNIYIRRRSISDSRKYCF